MKYIERYGDRLDGRGFPRCVLQVTCAEFAMSALGVCVTPPLALELSDEDTWVESVHQNCVILVKRTVCMSVVLKKSGMTQT